MAAGSPRRRLCVSPSLREIKTNHIMPQHDPLTSPVRKAYRGGQMYNASCSGAFADVILRTFFGVEFTLNAHLHPHDPAADRGFVGTLTNVRAKSAAARESDRSLWAIHSAADGLRLKKL